MNRVLLAFLFALPLSSFGDGSQEWTAPSPHETFPQGSAASFDKRLPPVLPGEELTVGSKKMNVWSTAGNVRGATPVPSSEGTNLRETLGVNELNVTVDGRIRPLPTTTP